MIVFLLQIELRDLTLLQASKFAGHLREDDGRTPSQITGDQMNIETFQNRVGEESPKLNITFGSPVAESRIEKLKAKYTDLPTDALDLWRSYDGFVIDGDRKNSPLGEFAILKIKDVFSGKLADNGLFENPQFMKGDIILSGDANGDAHLVWRPQSESYVFIDVAGAMNFAIGEKIADVLDFVFNRFVKEKKKFGKLYRSLGTTKRTFEVPMIGDRDERFCRQTENNVWMVKNEHIMVFNYQDGNEILVPSFRSFIYRYNQALEPTAELSVWSFGIAQMRETLVLVAKTLDDRLGVFALDLESRELSKIKLCSKRYPFPDSPIEMITSDSLVYFVLQGTDMKYELWRTDLTSKGTKKIKAFKQRCQNLIAHEDSVLFIGG